MARLSKRTKVEPESRTDAVVGRELEVKYRRESEAMADTLTEGEQVQYWDGGWRVGHVDKLPDADEPRYGEVRIIHAQTGRVWVAARDVRKIK